MLQEGLETRNKCPFFTPRGKAPWFLTWDNSRGGSGAFEQEECLRGLPVHSVVLCTLLVLSTSEAAGFCVENPKESIENLLELNEFSKVT